MKIWLHHINPFNSLTKSRRRVQMKINKFSKECLDFSTARKMMEMQYDTLLDYEYLCKVSDATDYRDQFRRVLQQNNELLERMGKNIDACINRSVHTLMSEADKAQLGQIVDIYMLLQKKYVLMYKFYELPVKEIEASWGSTHEAPPGDTALLVSKWMESIKQFVGEHRAENNT